MTSEEMQTERESLTIELKRLDQEYILAQSLDHSFNKRKEIRENVRALTSRIEEINKQIGNL